jgi:hypothetical protein
MPVHDRRADGDCKARVPFRDQFVNLYCRINDWGTPAGVWGVPQAPQLYVQADPLIDMSHKLHAPSYKELFKWPQKYLNHLQMCIKILHTNNTTNLQITDKSVGPYLDTNIYVTACLICGHI